MSINYQNVIDREWDYNLVFWWKIYSITRLFIYIYIVSDFFHLVQHQKQKLYALSIYSVNYIGFSIASQSMISIKYIFYSLLCNKLERKYFEYIQIEPKNSNN